MLIVILSIYRKCPESLIGLVNQTEDLVLSVKVRVLVVALVSLNAWYALGKRRRPVFSLGIPTYAI